MSAPYTETALSTAFLKALAKWAERHTDNDRIAIPTGTATAAELVLVLRALRLTRESESAP
jgi:2-methylcitrate dehydratase PrpD